MNINQDRVSLIKDHLFDSCDVLKSIRLKKRNYLGRLMTRKVVNDSEELVYSEIKPKKPVLIRIFFATTCYVIDPKKMIPSSSGMISWKK